MEKITIQNYMINSELNVEKIVRDFNNYIYTIVKNMASNIFTDEDIEEITEDVLFAVWKNKNQIEMDRELKPYIAGITKNLTKNKLREIKNGVTCIDEIEDIPNQIDIEEIIDNRENFQKAEKELRKMSQTEIKIFTMFYYYGKRTKEIAKELNYTEVNINTKLHRIKRKLKESLKRGGFSYGE